MFAPAFTLTLGSLPQAAEGARPGFVSSAGRADGGVDRGALAPQSASEGWVRRASERGGNRAGSHLRQRPNTSALVCNRYQSREV